MHILVIATNGASELQERWSKFGIASTFLPSGSVLDVIHDDRETRHLLADAIVFVPDALAEVVEDRPAGSLGPADAVILATNVRRLPDHIAMPDGRKWNALPMLVLTSSPNDGDEAFGAATRAEIEGLGKVNTFSIETRDDRVASEIKAAIREYRQRVLSELDDLGFIVEYEAGRYRLGPALKPRNELAGHYYFGNADKRPDTFITVDRDLLAIQTEVELFEALLNRADVSEADLQRFFEEYPHFLSTVAQSLPHVRFETVAGQILIPDFILRPIVAVQRDSRWEVLDLKRPQASMLAGTRSRRRLSFEVMAAVRQLRDYGDYFADARHAEQVEHKLGHRLRKPKLGVLIGRLRNVDTEALESEQSRIPDVRIITYDEILETQRALIA